jgi:hypothetical protein
MKTRVLAKSLRQLADWLDRLPDQSLEDLAMQRLDMRTKSASLALNVATLASLSRVDRKSWIEFIRQHGFPIDIRPRDASRDILGKLLKFLEEEPEAINYLQRRAHEDVATSPQLSRALRALLNYPG